MVTAFVPRIVRNDYSVLSTAADSQWSPHHTVSVIIPAYGNADKLRLTLAALAAQTYPSELTEVIVVDDNSEPPLRLGPLRPDHTRLVRPPRGRWGSAYAVNYGASVSNGEVIVRLDADMVPFADHLEAQLRWHSRADYLAVIGHKRFIGYHQGDFTPENIFDRVTSDTIGSLKGHSTSHSHWIEQVIDDTDQLRAARVDSYRVFVGATGSLKRDLFEEVGGLDSSLPLGSDTEFAYRLAQAGAVFVPELTSSAWHLGKSQMQSSAFDGRRFRTPFVAQRVPLMAARRTSPGRTWQVPFVDVVVNISAGYDVDQVDATVAPLLNGSASDIRLWLVHDSGWPATEARTADMNDPATQLRLIQELYRHEPRIHLVDESPDADPVVPYRLLMPQPAPTTPATIDRLVRVLNAEQAGLLLVTLGDGSSARMERHSAFARARRLARDPNGDPYLYDRLVAETWGVAQRDSLDKSSRSTATAFTVPPPSWARRAARRFLPGPLRQRLHTLRKV